MFTITFIIAGAAAAVLLPMLVVMPYNTCNTCPLVKPLLMSGNQMEVTTPHINSPAKKKMMKHSTPILGQGIMIRIFQFGCLDPMAGKYPSMSPYMYCAGNPVILVDPNGSDIDPTSTGYKDAKRAATPVYNKRGKQTSNDYQSAFAEIYNKWNDDKSILVKFNKTSDGGGTIGFDGENDKGQKTYSVTWNSELTTVLGTSGMFEESYHLKETLDGIEMSFPEQPNSGVKNLDIYDEVRAKLWVCDNISIKTTYGLGDNYLGYTHYGFIKTKLKTVESIRNALNDGVPEQQGFIDPKSTGSSGSTFGGVSGYKYTPSNFGGVDRNGKESPYKSFFQTPRP